MIKTVRYLALIKKLCEEPCWRVLNLFKYVAHGTAQTRRHPVCSFKICQICCMLRLVAERREFARTSPSASLRIRSLPALSSEHFATPLRSAVGQEQLAAGKH